MGKLHDLLNIDPNNSLKKLNQSVELAAIQHLSDYIGNFSLLNMHAETIVLGYRAGN